MSIKSCKIGALWVCVVLSMVCATALRAEPECKAVQQTKPTANSAEQTAEYEAVMASYNTQETAKETPPPDPYADAQIMVEAFVVEVSTEGLKDLGVSPLGQASDGISIAKLTDCLVQDKNAKVISGAKVVSKQNEHGESNDKKTVYLKQITKLHAVSNDGKPIETSNVQFRDYRFEKQLKFNAKIVSDNEISVGYVYLESGFQIDSQNYDPNDAFPPATYSYDWRGLISLQPGKPSIAAAVQDRNSVVFLVLTATIQKEPPTPAAEEKKEKSK